MWPPMGLPALSAASRLMASPTRRPPSAVRFKVSGTAVAENPSEKISSAVKQTPLQETLSPSLRPEAITGADIRKRIAGPDELRSRKTPTSSTMPVNIAYPRPPKIYPIESVFPNSTRKSSLKEANLRNLRDFPQVRSNAAPHLRPSGRNLGAVRMNNRSHNPEFKNKPHNSGPPSTNTE